jgi:hypothetical protein
MSIYLDDFRKKIESAHDFTTCHWTTIDKFGSQAKGPCTCPTAEPCLEHNMVNCENTLAVLGKSTAAEVTYGPQLDELEKSVRQIEDIVRQAKDMIHNLTHPSAGGSAFAPGHALGPSVAANEEKAMEDSLFQDVMKNNYTYTKSAVEYIISGCKITIAVPYFDGQGYCVCFDNKVARLRALQLHLSRMNSVVNNVQSNMEEMGDDLDTSKIRLKDFLEIVKMGLELVSLSMEITGVGIGIGVVGSLAIYASEKYFEKDGPKYFVFFNMLVWLGLLKADVMMNTIYYEQEMAALTCQPRGTHHSGPSPSPPTETAHPRRKERPPNSDR